MQIYVSDIVKEFSQWNLFLKQNGPDNQITGMPDIQDSGKGDLVFVESEEYVPFVLQKKPSAVITNEKLAEQFKQLTETSILVSTNAKLAQALLRKKYMDRNLRDNGWAQIHDSAVIHETADLHTSVSIGPNAVISKNVMIGENSVVMANAVIEEGVSVGDDCVIYPNAVISYECVMGDRCIIMSGTVIGAEGFGFAQDSQQKSYRVPQLGNVILGDDVVVGANCTIDRATFKSTKIGNGCKFDNLIHIAHNVEVGEDALMAAQCGVAGSTKIGKRVRFGGQTGTYDHVSIGDDTIFVHRSAVIQDIEEPGIYAGLPPIPLRQWSKSTAVFKQLEGLKKTVDGLAKDKSK
ncbi:MAG: UDP-3-O-(3-hydroxymyristoyl)glucosamine N-acyltransferase [Pseudomonadota bacterium]